MTEELKLDRWVVVVVLLLVVVDNVVDGGLRLTDAMSITMTMSITDT